MDSTSTLVTIAAAAASSWLVLASNSHRRPVKRRHHYLTRPTLPLIHQSAWRIVINSGDDKALLNTTSFNIEAFVHLQQLFIPQWNNKYHHHHGRSRCMKAVDVLGLVLKYLTSCYRAKELCQIFAQPPAVISRNLRSRHTDTTVSGKK